MELFHLSLGYASFFFLFHLHVQPRFQIFLKLYYYGKHIYFAISYKFESVMVLTKKSPTNEICCGFSKDLPDAIQKDLDKEGGMEGLLARIPDASALHAGSRLHQALADPIRLTVMYSLRSHPLCVCVIKEVVKIADSKLSYHLSILKEQDLIAGEQQGNWIIYSITHRGRQALKCTEKVGM
jgi:ArsR family transcriptional regulator